MGKVWVGEGFWSLAESAVWINQRDSLFLSQDLHRFFFCSKKRRQSHPNHKSRPQRLCPQKHQTSFLHLCRWNLTSAVQHEFGNSSETEIKQFTNFSLPVVCLWAYAPCNREIQLAKHSVKSGPQHGARRDRSQTHVVKVRYFIFKNLGPRDAGVDQYKNTTQWKQIVYTLTT